MRCLDLTSLTKIVRKVRAVVKGEKNSYARGFRDALRYVERDIAAKIEALRGL
jgi:hypothetical protein